MRRVNVLSARIPSTLLFVATICGVSVIVNVARSDQPARGETKVVDLGHGDAIELVYIPPGQFMMGSTPEERSWATGIEGGAAPGTARETYEGEARPMRVKDGFWMGLHSRAS